MDSNASNQEQQNTPLVTDSQVAAEMSKFISPEKPRDEKGRFVPQQQESSPAQEQVEEEKPAEQPTEEAAEEVESFLEEPDFKKKAKIKVQGEELVVPLKEALEGYMRQQDYTRKTQETAKERREAQEKYQKELETERGSYLSNLKMLRETTLQVAHQELAGVDLNKLAADDPAGYVRAVNRINQFESTLKQIAEKEEQVSKQQAEERQKALAKHLEEAQKTLAEKIPNWGEEVNKALTDRGVKTYGFSAHEMSAVYDPRIVEVLHDAHQYRLLKEKGPSLEKKVQEVPKVLKPGAQQAKTDPRAKEAAEASQKLKQTGSVDAFADYLRATSLRK
jgi:hypothetical protein